MGYSSKLRESFMNFIVDNNILRGFFCLQIYRYKKSNLLRCYHQLHERELIIFPKLFIRASRLVLCKWEGSSEGNGK